MEKNINKRHTCHLNDRANRCFLLHPFRWPFTIRSASTKDILEARTPLSFAFSYLHDSVLCADERATYFTIYNFAPILLTSGRNYVCTYVRVSFDFLSPHHIYIYIVSVFDRGEKMTGNISIESSPSDALQLLLLRSK